MDEKMQEQNDAGTAQYRPRLALYHANPRGTGCAITINLHPAHDFKGGCIMLNAAAQCAVGGKNGGKTEFNRFDWQNAVTVKLDFDDLCQFLQVFRGESESICEGRGLFHTSSAATAKIGLRHIVEPLSGYVLDIYRTPRGGTETHVRFMFTPSEAAGLCCAIESSMLYVCFGLPVVLPQERAAAGTARKGSDDAAA